MSKNLLWAYVRINIYLLLIGMWRGECQWCGYDDAGRTILMWAGPPTSAKTVDAEVLKESARVAYQRRLVFYARPL